MLQPRDLKGRTAISYARWSSGKQANGDSLRRQSENAQSFCASYGLTLDQTLTDEGVSAFKGANLEATLGQFVADVKAGKIPSDVVLIVENIDRISRVTPRKAFNYFSNLLDTGLTIVTLTDNRVHTGDEYDDNFSHLMMSLMAMQAANEYSKKLSFRVGEAWKRKPEAARAGRVKVSKLPFWIDRATNELNERADDARLIFKLAQEGHGQQVITQTLNAKGIPSPAGGTWAQPVVSGILRNPAAYGTLVLKGEAIPGYFPALITETEWLATRQRTKGRHRSRQVSNTSNLFSRIVYCSHCGSSMAMTSSKSAAGVSNSYFVCTGRTFKRTDCTAPNWNYSTFEREFLSRIGFMAMPVENVEAEANDIQATLEATIGALEAKRTNVLAGVADAGSIDVVRLLTSQADTLSREIDGKKRELARARENDARYRESAKIVVDFEADQAEIERMAKEDRKGAQRLLGDMFERVELESAGKDLRRAIATLRSGHSYTVVFDA